ncbi:TetR/AcrR family transcriptional regulator [Amycolatopsis sp. 195334CR]|uniref:TetR/AcrR family transcriptional regulator n=1 Tax=Amycolatopsis sp. 195334CR TaxID=2814588 RepID=UPI001A8EBF02|nr:TetR/AcrR family transcriptional regulator [Amycolatopsis sp. 195334CR]MBN6033877.1 TetR/AcrR family transcriptional regulator [Amycolatopsis sp. 195334CR]
MASRAESAAATRRALVDAAADLLDSGGPDAVTLRAVGARAGVTRGAPYGHFPDKDSLLTTVAAEALERLADQVRAVRTDPEVPAADTLRRGLGALMTIGRHQPHLYRLMFTTPAGAPAAVQAATEAADRAMDEFLAIVGGVVGGEHTQRYAALLLSSAHGITDLEVNGHLAAHKWAVTPEDLVGTLIAMIGHQT